MNAVEKQATQQAVSVAKLDTEMNLLRDLPGQVHKIDKEIESFKGRIIGALLVFSAIIPVATAVLVRWIGKT